MKKTNLLVKVLGFILFFIFILMHIDTTLVIPKAGLDPSWKMTLNWAWENEVSFGKDLIFTYGPLGFLQHTIYPQYIYHSLVFSIFSLLMLWHLFYARTSFDLFKIGQ